MSSDAPERRAATTDLADTSALWRAGLVGESEVVRATTEALVAGLDGPTLRMVAGLPAHDPDRELDQLLPSALAEQGLPSPERDSTEAAYTALVALARQVSTGRRTPRELAWWANSGFGCRLDLAETLAEADVLYEEVEVIDLTIAEIDAIVLAEARRLVGETADVNPTDTNPADVTEPAGSTVETASDAEA